MTSPAQASEQSAQQMSSAVGFQFVRQYYTVLNKDPAKLHCFYKKHSLFTHGNESGQNEAVTGQIVRVPPRQPCFRCLHRWLAYEVS
jgi:hypothetical protein